MLPVRSRSAKAAASIRRPWRCSRARPVRCINRWACRGRRPRADAAGITRVTPAPEESESTNEAILLILAFYNMQPSQNLLTIRNLQFTRRDSYIITSDNGSSVTCTLDWGEIWMQFELFVDGHSAGLASTTPLTPNSLPNEPKPGGIPSNWDETTTNAGDWLIPRFDGDFQQLLLEYDAATVNTLLIKGSYKINQYQACTPAPEWWTSGPGDFCSVIKPPQTNSFSPSANIAELIKISEQDPEKSQNGYTTLLTGETIIPPGFKQGFTPSLEILIRVPVLGK